MLECGFARRRDVGCQPYFPIRPILQCGFDFGFSRPLPNGVAYERVGERPSTAPATKNRAGLLTFLFPVLSKILPS